MSLTDEYIPALLVQILEEIDTDQSKAVIDALAIAVYADFDTNEEEIAMLSDLLKDVPFTWDDDDAAAAYTAKAMDRALNLPDHQLRSYVGDIAERLPVEVWPKVYEMCVSIVMADQERNLDEDIVLQTFSDAFGLTRDVVDAIEAEVAGQIAG